MTDFWSGIDDARLMARACLSCGAYELYPHARCRSCGGTETEWRELSGHGQVYTWTTVHRPPRPPFGEWVPYSIAVVEMDEGVRVPGWIASEALAVGQPVVARFEQGPDRTLPVFHATGGQS